MFFVQIIQSKNTDIFIKNKGLRKGHHVYIYITI